MVWKGCSLLPTQLLPESSLCKVHIAARQNDAYFLELLLPGKVLELMCQGSSQPHSS